MTNFIDLLITIFIVTCALVIPELIPLKLRCWWSKYLWDIHDYPKRKGGDDYPTHFHIYTCHKCNKNFKI